jgi:iron complex outermembrane recepter protein
MRTRFSRTGVSAAVAVEKSTSILRGSAVSIVAIASLSAVAAVAQSTAPLGLEEIIVTATKRPEAARDISGSVSAYSGEQLEQLGAETMEDYVTRLPGVVFNQQTPGDSTVTVRGVSTGQDPGQGTTGYFINDVPLSDPGFSIGTPDIDTFDVDNIVVLRGPQGTLFGSGTLGGAINYQAARPVLTQFDMRLQGTVDSTEDGSDGDAERIMFNVPIVADKFAVRGVYSNRNIAGYLDNIGTGQQDSNSTRIEGGRFQALWQPSEHTSINYLYLEQTTDNADGYAERIGLGLQQRSTLVPESSHFNTVINTLRLDQQVSFGILTAIVTQHRKENNHVRDVTDPVFGIPNLGGTGPLTVTQAAEAEGTTYEVRFASAPGGSIEYLIGVMHDETDQEVAQSVNDPGSAATLDLLIGPGAGAALAPGDRTLTIFLPFQSKESAIFGEVTYRFNDAWKATVGGRAFQQEISSQTASSGIIAQILTGASPVNFVGPPAKEEGFNPKFSLSWTPDDRFMAYGLVSKGFRIGGPNVTPSLPGQPVPAAFESDSLINYEVGIRSDLVGGHLLLDLTGFFIDWDNIQLNRQTTSSLNFGINAGAAEVYGIEASTALQIVDGLTLRSALTYTDATISEDIPGYPIATVGAVPAGSELPGASDWLVSNVLTYEWSAGSLEPSLALLQRYVSEAPSAIDGGFVEGDYNVFDARFRLNWDRFGVTAFVENIGDERGVVQADDVERIYIRPRTFGITIDFKL